MSNQLFNPGREGFLAGEIDADTAVIKVVGVDTGAYTFSAAHKFLSSIPGAARIFTSAALSSKTVTDGVFDAADPTMTNVSGASVEALCIYQSSAVTGGADVADTLQRLIAWIDTSTGLPMTPNGGDISIQWDNTANRIFKL